MRKIRINIFDDDPINLRLFAAIMSPRDYEVNIYDRAVSCPIYNTQAEAECSRLKPCADIILTDNQMPGMTGIEMLLEQAQRGCKVDCRNKAVASADLDYQQRKIVEGLGCVVFEKPFRLKDLVTWLDECDRRVDLSNPLGIIRKEARYRADFEMVYATETDEMFHAGTAMNYSVSGLCLRTDTLLAEGQSVVVKSDLPNDCRIASVCWANEMEGGFCFAGISCR